jgi:hypothetical protein
MNDAVCADCTMLQKAALAAIMQHNLAESRLAIAKLHHDSPSATILEPQVEHLLEERRAAVQAAKNISPRTHKKPQVQDDLTENSHKR